MELQARARRRLWSLRFLQALVAGVAVGGVLALTATAEGLAPWPLALLGALLAVALVLLTAPPWLAPDRAIDPAADEDGLLRTALSPRLAASRADALAGAASQRRLRFRALPEWQAWAVFLLIGASASAWTLLEPDALQSGLARGSLNPQGLALDGGVRKDAPAPATSPDLNVPPPPSAEDPLEDGVDGSERGQWQRVPEMADGSAVRLGMDLGLEQGVYERYLRNRAKRP
ncbi:MAG: hypothetical protein ACPG31_09615 [Planctomycetota bacterium]